MQQLAAKQAAGVARQRSDIAQHIAALEAESAVLQQQQQQTAFAAAVSQHMAAANQQMAAAAQQQQQQQQQQMGGGGANGMSSSAPFDNGPMLSQVATVQRTASLNLALAHQQAALEAAAARALSPPPPPPPQQQPPPPQQQQQLQTQLSGFEMLSVASSHGGGAGGESQYDVTSRASSLASSQV